MEFWNHMLNPQFPLGTFEIWEGRFLGVFFNGLFASTTHLILCILIDFIEYFLYKESENSEEN